MLNGQDDDARKMRDARRNQDMQRQARSATDRAKREDNRKVSDVLSDDEDHSQPSLMGSAAELKTQSLVRTKIYSPRWEYWVSTCRLAPW